MAYALTNEANKDTKDAFCNSLEDALKLTGRSNLIFIYLGDLNAFRVYYWKPSPLWLVPFLNNMLGYWNSVLLPDSASHVLYGFIGEISICLHGCFPMMGDTHTKMDTDPVLVNKRWITQTGVV